jgi:serine/threonine-protein phosphatase 2B catalytic subunit
MDGQAADQNAYIDNAIRAVQNKKQIPEIDFTLHTMEDGTQVSTQERVCKGMSCNYFNALTSRTVQLLRIEKQSSHIENRHS